MTRDDGSARQLLVQRFGFFGLAVTWLLSCVVSTIIWQRGCPYLDRHHFVGASWWTILILVIAPLAGVPTLILYIACWCAWDFGGLRGRRFVNAALASVFFLPFAGFTGWWVGAVVVDLMQRIVDWVNQAAGA